MQLRIALVLLLSVATHAANSTCFPLGGAKFNGSKPSMDRNDWWCGNDRMYGFLGFSYPMEEGCGSSTSYDRISKDMQRMKKDYGATFVRTYLTTCRDVSVYKNLVKAGRDNNMGVIPMLFWDFGPNDKLMKQAENALLAVFQDAEVGKFAPYVIHSVAFGDELGEEGQYWMKPFNDLKAKLAKYGVPLTISDDWDRGEYKSGNSLSNWGKQVRDAVALTHVHIQGYYHPGAVPNARAHFNYLKGQVNFMKNNNIKRPYIISQTLWTSGKGGHAFRGNVDNMDNFSAFWNDMQNNCQYFKQEKVSYFFHAWSDGGEAPLGLLKNNGQAKISFRPQRC